jgi:hypothetical protein
MSRKKEGPPPTKIPAGVRRVPGVLSCKVCKFQIPYQGFEDSTLEERPTHRCVDEIRPFDKFDTQAPRIKVRQW